MSLSRPPSLLFLRRPSTMSNKRSRITSFFTPLKKPRGVSPISTLTTAPPTSHKTYPFPIAALPDALTLSPPPTVPEPKTITTPETLDLLYFRPLLPSAHATALFTHLRASLPWYRVHYTIPRGKKLSNVWTPRFTTLFGVDDTSEFVGDDNRLVVAESDSRAIYKTCTPRPIPACLMALKNMVEERTGAKFNFVLVNYYAHGNDSISWHSDNEDFLGHDPTVASLSLGAARDFWMRSAETQLEASIQHKTGVPDKRVEFVLRNGECLLMRGQTQDRWEHTVPKLKDGAIESGLGGRVNVTFRWVARKEGTENYYRYNVGTGRIYKWDEDTEAMVEWRRPGEEVKMVNGKKKFEYGKWAGDRKELENVKRREREKEARRILYRG